MNPIQSNNSQNTSARAIDLYARAAATLYGIISFNDFVKILEVYYGEGILSRDRIMTYFLASDNDDPIYYIHDEWIVHATIFPYEIASTLLEIHGQNPRVGSALADLWPALRVARTIDWAAFGIILSFSHIISQSAARPSFCFRRRFHLPQP